MSDVLAEICAEKRAHIARRKAALPEAALRAHLAAAPSLRPFAAALENRASQPFLTYLHQLPGAANYFFPGLARLVRPCPLYFEIGDRDGLSNNTFGRDHAFAKIQSAYREVDAAGAVTLRVFAGGHEVAGTEAIAWLSAQLSNV